MATGPRAAARYRRKDENMASSNARASAHRGSNIEAHISKLARVKGHGPAKCQGEESENRCRRGHLAYEPQQRVAKPAAARK